MPGTLIYVNPAKPTIQQSLPQVTGVGFPRVAPVEKSQVNSMDCFRPAGECTYFP